MIVKLLCGLFVLCATPHAFAWTDGELLVWINGDKGYNGLAEIGKKFEKDYGIKVTVEHPESLTDKFQAAAQGGKGPDIMFWAHDRIGEWADAGLLKPITFPGEVKDKFVPMAWDAVTHNGQIFGYPVALEAISLIYNKNYVTGAPPTQLDGFPAFSQQLKSKHPDVIAIMWDYGTPYFSWPFLASGGGYAFKKTQDGYDVNDIGVDSPGAVKGLQEIVSLINSGVLPKGASYSVMDQKMNSGKLATMISGPWAWSNLRKSGIDFGLAPLPGVDGKPGKPFVGVLVAMINRATPNSDLAGQFLEKFVITEDGLKTIDADVPIGVPALKAAYNDFAAKNPLVKTTFENIQNGEIMPNIPQMGRFWSAMTTVFQTATNGQASPQAALADAKHNMEK